MPLLTRVRTRNYRSLADVSADVGSVTVLFGHNGSGKSTFLDVAWFLRDCALNGVDIASERRGHGIGLLWDGADERDPIVLGLTVEGMEYELRCSLSAGRIDPRMGERLVSSSGDLLLERTPGSDRVQFFVPGGTEPTAITLREPNKLSLVRYLDHTLYMTGAAALDMVIRATHWHHSRSFRWWQLKIRGSESGSSVTLAEDGRNLWSVLRNLHDRRSVDERYETILDYMRESFPGFRDLVFEATSGNSIYCSMVDIRRKVPVAASGMSDGHLQMLLLLTALFAPPLNEPLLLLLDEPEVSLHPWPIAVLARAIKRACAERPCQVMIATHSPVLLSQFAADEILTASLVGGQTRLRRVSEIAEITDLLDQYAIGSLYMAEAIAPQSTPEGERG